MWGLPWTNLTTNSWLWQTVWNLTYVFLNVCTSAKTNVYPVADEMVCLNFYKVRVIYMGKGSTEKKSDTFFFNGRIISTNCYSSMSSGNAQRNDIKVVEYLNNWNGEMNHYALFQPPLCSQFRVNIFWLKIPCLIKFSSPFTLILFWPLTRIKLSISGLYNYLR